jgi:Tol biopolymer transport system component
VTRRGLWVGILVLSLLAILVASAGAASPEGPRLLFTLLSTRTNALTVVTSDLSGTQRQVVAGGGRNARPLPDLLVAPQWSPDGAEVVFTGLTGHFGGEDDSPEAEIYIVASDGSSLRPVPRTAEGLDPIFTQDGHSVAFALQRQHQGRVPRRGEVTTYRSISTWMVNVDGENLRQLTPWRNGLENEPSSLSPDGKVLVLSRRTSTKRQSEVVAMRLDGSGSTVLARNAGDAVYSPDGSRLALLRIHARAGRESMVGRKPRASSETTTDLFVINSDGSNPRRLTNTPGKLELWPSWDLSGQRLAYTQFNGGTEAGFFGVSDAIMEINADGSCRTKVLSEQGSALYGAAWQPGPGREAGPIAC